MTKPAFWDTATRELARRDRVLGKLIAAHPDIHLTRRGDPFTTLARSIVGQQISVKAAQAVWDRFAHAAQGGAAADALGVALDPARVARMRVTTMRRCGFSERKAEYVRDLARHFVTGRLEPHTWGVLDDEALIEALVDVKGIGRWTAEMFLMFHELRADVLPVGDIGLQNAMALLYNNGERMLPPEMREFAERWAPWRSVATWYLWRSLEPLPVVY
ncbi:MAG: DNA-3-methyladenine glycosylase 2 family protein [Betaproteobacteria bacterium]